MAPALPHRPALQLRQPLEQVEAEDHLPAAQATPFWLLPALQGLRHWDKADAPVPDVVLPAGQAKQSKLKCVVGNVAGSLQSMPALEQ